MNATYTKKATLDFKDLWTHFGLTKDNAGRWEVSAKTQDWVVDFLRYHRSPSRNWPLSYAKPMLTQKFAKLVTDKDSELAVTLGLATKD